MQRLLAICENPPITRFHLTDTYEDTLRYLGALLTRYPDEVTVSEALKPKILGGGFARARILFPRRTQCPHCGETLYIKAALNKEATKRDSESGWPAGDQYDYWTVCPKRLPLTRHWHDKGKRTATLDGLNKMVEEYGFNHLEVDEVRSQLAG